MGIQSATFHNYSACMANVIDNYAVSQLKWEQIQLITMHFNRIKSL